MEHPSLIASFSPFVIVLIFLLLKLRKGKERERYWYIYKQAAIIIVASLFFSLFYGVFYAITKNEGLAIIIAIIIILATYTVWMLLRNFKLKKFYKDKG